MDNRWLAGKNQRGPAAISESQSKVDNCEGWITDDVGFNLKQLANSAVLSSGKINGHLVRPLAAAHAAWKTHLILKRRMGLV